MSQQQIIIASIVSNMVALLLLFLSRKSKSKYDHLLKHLKCAQNNLSHIARPFSSFIFTTG